MAEHGDSKEEDTFDKNFDGLLFINESGHSMHFIFLMNDSAERDKLKKKVEHQMGCVHTSVEDIGPHSIVLTDLDNMTWKHDRIERFKIGYIKACFDKNKILDINKFTWDTSNIYKKHFDFFKVVLYRVYTWDTIPEEYLIKPPSGSEEVVSESDTDSDDSFMNTNYEPELPSKQKNPHKHTRHSYSKTEKETIVKYIVEKKAYDRLKGREVWQELERRDLCPKRTWQSLKEHTIKAISKEITQFNYFTFLTPKQREKLNKALSKPRER